MVVVICSLGNKFVLNYLLSILISCLSIISCVLICLKVVLGFSIILDFKLIDFVLTPAGTLQIVAKQIPSLFCHCLMESEI